jgi:hypothetical protein
LSKHLQEEHPSTKGKVEIRPVVSHKERLRGLEPFHKDDVSFHAPMKTAIIVPSTKNGNERISKPEYDRRVRETERFMAKEYGGYTAVQAHGGYLGERGEVIEEPVTEVVAYTDAKTFRAKKPVVAKFMKRKRSSWTQESVGYEFDKNAELYYYKGS